MVNAGGWMLPEELLDIFLCWCELTRVYYLWRPNLRDEADNRLRPVSPEDFLKEL